HYSIFAPARGGHDATWCRGSVTAITQASMVPCSFGNRSGVLMTQQFVRLRCRRSEFDSLAACVSRCGRTFRRAADERIWHRHTHDGWSTTYALRPLRADRIRSSQERVSGPRQSELYAFCASPVVMAR